MSIDTSSSCHLRINTVFFCCSHTRLNHCDELGILLPFVVRSDSPSVNHLSYPVSPWLVCAGHTSEFSISCGCHTSTVRSALIFYPAMSKWGITHTAQLAWSQHGSLLKEEGYCSGRQAGFNVAFGACCCVCSFVVWRGSLTPSVCIFGVCVCACLTCRAAFSSPDSKVEERYRKYRGQFYNNRGTVRCRTLCKSSEGLLHAKCDFPLGLRRATVVCS